MMNKIEQKMYDKVDWNVLPPKARHFTQWCVLHIPKFTATLAQFAIVIFIAHRLYAHIGYEQTIITLLAILVLVMKRKG